MKIFGREIPSVSVSFSGRELLASTAVGVALTAEAAATAAAAAEQICQGQGFAQDLLTVLGEALADPTSVLTNTAKVVGGVVIAKTAYDATRVALNMFQECRKKPQALTKPEEQKDGLDGGLSPSTSLEDLSAAATSVQSSPLRHQ